MTEDNELTTTRGKTSASAAYRNHEVEL